MQLITKDELNERKEEIIEKILNGSIFIYPTDTIYGIGCNAMIDDSVKRMREWKKRQTPFSVIVPNKKWIKDNCDVCAGTLDKLPGPLTLVYQMKKQAVSKHTSEKTLGVRIPEHWIAEFVSELGVPIVTTSVNVTGEIPLFSLENMPEELKAFVDFAIDEGKLKAKASKVIDCTSGKILRD